MNACVKDFGIDCLDRNKFLTVQSNYLVIIWYGLFILWRNRPEKLSRLNGKFRGALVGYMLLVMLAYHFLLSGNDDTFWTFSNLWQHYVVSIIVFIQWLAYERHKYKWTFLFGWLLYPLAYAAFALIHVFLFHDFLYSFLDIETHGSSNVLLTVLLIVIFCIILALLVLAINRHFLADETLQG